MRGLWHCLIANKIQTVLIKNLGEKRELTRHLETSKSSLKPALEACRVDFGDFLLLLLRLTWSSASQRRWKTKLILFLGHTSPEKGTKLLDFNGKIMTKWLFGLVCKAEKQAFLLYYKVYYVLFVVAPAQKSRSSFSKKSILHTWAWDWYIFGTSPKNYSKFSWKSCRKWQFFAENPVEILQFFAKNPVEILANFPENRVEILSIFLLKIL